MYTLVCMYYMKYCLIVVVDLASNGILHHLLYFVPILQPNGEVTATVSWDSSVHDTVLLNRVTPANECIFIVIRVSNTYKYKYI